MNSLIEMVEAKENKIRFPVLARCKNIGDLGYKYAMFSSENNCTILANDSTKHYRDKIGTRLTQVNIRAWDILPSGSKISIIQNQKGQTKNA